MAYSKMHETDYLIQLKSGLRSALLTTATSNSGVQGEPHYTTDTKQLFIHDGTVVQPVQSLDMAMVKNGEILTKSGYILFKY